MEKKVSISLLLYVSFLIIAAAITSFFIYYSWSWLQSIGSPKDALLAANSHARVAWSLTWITSAILLSIANAVFWSTRTVWPLWATFIYFSAFVSAMNIWLASAFRAFLVENSSLERDQSGSVMIAIALIFLAAVIVFFDQYLLIRLHAKTYPALETGKPHDVEDLDKPSDERR